MLQDYNIQRYIIFLDRELSPKSILNAMIHLQFIFCDNNASKKIGYGLIHSLNMCCNVLQYIKLYLTHIKD